MTEAAEKDNKGKKLRIKRMLEQNKEDERKLEEEADRLKTVSETKDKAFRAALKAHRADSSVDNLRIKNDCELEKLRSKVRTVYLNTTIRIFLIGGWATRY